MAAQPGDPSLKVFIDEQDRLIAIALRIVESRAVAEEVVQESWLRWQRQSYAAEDAAPLFTSIVRNLAQDWRRARHREIQSLPDLAALRGDTPCSERAVIARDELKRVVRALRKLPPRTLHAFSLRFVDGLTYEQVGQRIGLSLSRSRTLIEDAMIEISIALS